MDESLLDRGLKSLETRARLATIAIYLFLADCVAEAVVDVAELTGAIDLHALPSQAHVDAINALFVSNSVLFLGSAVVIAFWIHRAHKNLFDAGIDGLEFTPGWSIGWFIVPIASLYMPFKAMREVWHVSLMEHNDGVEGSAPTELLGWWICFLLGNFLSYGASIPGLDLLAVAALAVSAWFLRMIIVRVTEAQRTTLQVANTFA